jgi:hypothetical protein
MNHQRLRILPFLMFCVAIGNAAYCSHFTNFTRNICLYSVSYCLHMPTLGTFKIYEQFYSDGM